MSELAILPDHAIFRLQLSVVIFTTASQKKNLSAIILENTVLRGIFIRPAVSVNEIKAGIRKMVEFLGSSVIALDRRI